MPAGATAAYPGSVETMQIIGDAQQQQKSVQEVQIVHLQQQQQQEGVIPVLDRKTAIPAESQQQHQNPHHLAAAQLAQMATIVSAGGVSPILPPVGPIAVTIAPNGALLNPAQVIDYGQLNGAPAGPDEAATPIEVEGSGPAAGEYYIQAAPASEVVHTVLPPDQLIMAQGGALLGSVAATSEGMPITFDQLKQLLQTQLEYYFSR